MKYVKILFLLALSCQLASCQSPKPKKFNSKNLQYYDLIGKVKSVELIYIDERFLQKIGYSLYKGYVDGIKDTVQINFDDKGNIIKCKTLRYSIKNSDDFGKNFKNIPILIDSISSYYGFLDNLFDYSIYVEDSAGLLKDRSEYQKYEYNEHGDCKRIQNQKGGYVRKVDEDFEYDYYHYEYEYDKYNNWIKRIKIYSKEKTYNEETKVIENTTVRKIIYF